MKTLMRSSDLRLINYYLKESKSTLSVKIDSNRKLYYKHRSSLLTYMTCFVQVLGLCFQRNLKAPLTCPSITPVTSCSKSLNRLQKSQDSLFPFKWWWVRVQPTDILVETWNFFFTLNNIWIVKKSNKPILWQSLQRGNKLPEAQRFVRKDLTTTPSD